MRRILSRVDSELTEQFQRTLEGRYGMFIVCLEHYGTLLFAHDSSLLVPTLLLLFVSLVILSLLLVVPLLFCWYCSWCS